MTAKTGEQARRKRRKTRQRKLARHSKRREDAQLSGREPTLPAGAARGNERVSPLVQGDQPLPALIERAIRNKWAVPDEIKPILVDELTDIVLDKSESAPPPVVKVMAFNALAKADQAQHEQDNPEAAGKAKGGVTINNSNQVAVAFPFGALYKPPEGGNRIEAKLKEAEADEGKVRS